MAVRKVGTCEITRELGRGGMGVVYEAEQPMLGRKVAVKELPAELAKNKEFVERFKREGKVYASLQHQAIVGVYDLIEKNDAYYLVTEFVDGADLHKLMQQGGPFPPVCAAIVGARVAEALDHVHFHKLLHRDIKPANVMLSRYGEVKLMDFGIAKDQTADDLTREGLLVGSPSYLAPEVLGGERNDAQSEIWALGVMLYELVTGQKPFTGKDQGSLFLAIRRGRFPPVRGVAPNVPSRLARAIERCLRVKAKDRWRSAAELGAELDICAGRFLQNFHPQARLLSLMEQRGYGLPVDNRTAIDAGSLIITIDEDSRSMPAPTRSAAERWARALAATVLAMAAACAGVAYWLHVKS
ncbi:MAG: serine/threonine protein kinase [Deltaproteobacteria bacterium]|nr:serine/threonine protein kinase [Deltaproteobacteria bacterium]